MLDFAHGLDRDVWIGCPAMAQACWGFRNDLRDSQTPVSASGMTPVIRKLMLIAHIAASVGWMGATAAFLALAIAGMTSHDDTLARSAYLAMKLIGWRVVVPFGLASLVTGLVQSLGATWGLFRHYWVLLKFVLTVIATGLLLLHMNLATRLADVAVGPLLPLAHLRGLRLHIMADAAAAIALLMVNTTLSVYKPRGMTLYGRRKQWEECTTTAAGAVKSDAVSTPGWVKAFGITVFVLVILFRVILVHLSGGFGHHIH